MAGKQKRCADYDYVTFWDGVMVVNCAMITRYLITIKVRGVNMCGMGRYLHLLYPAPNPTDKPNQINNTTEVVDIESDSAVLPVVLASVILLFGIGGVLVIKYRKNQEKRLISPATGVRFRQMVLIKEQPMRDKPAQHDDTGTAVHGAPLAMIIAGTHTQKGGHDASCHSSIQHLMARKSVANQKQHRLNSLNPGGEDIKKDRSNIYYGKRWKRKTTGQAALRAFGFNNDGENLIDIHSLHQYVMVQH